MNDPKKLTNLISQIKGDDSYINSPLYTSFYQNLYNYILNKINDAELAESLTQDSIAAIRKKIDNLLFPSSFSLWSRHIARLQCAAYINRRKQLMSDDPSHNSLMFLHPHTLHNQDNLRETISTLLDSLSDEERAAIVMRYYDELSLKDISKNQNISIKTVKKNLEHGRSIIEDALKNLEHKYNLQIHNTGVIPILLWFFKEDRLRNGISPTKMTPLAEAMDIVLRKATKAIIRKVCVAICSACIVFIGAVLFPSDSTIPSTESSELSSTELDTSENTELTTETESSTSETEEPTSETEEPTPETEEPTSETEEPTESTDSQTATESETPSTSEKPTPEPVEPEVQYSKGLQFVLSDDELSYWVSGIGTCTDTQIYIPPEYNRMQVTGITATAFLRCRATQIVLPDTIEYIGDEAFSWATNLKKIEIPKSVTKLGTNLFYRCISLTSLSVNDSNPVYHSNGNCIIDTKNKKLIAGCIKSKIPTNGSVTIIGKGAFTSGGDFFKITIPEGVTLIEDIAFSNTPLQSISFPSTLVEIGDNAFNLCTNLSKLTFKEGLTTIGQNAFGDCRSLTTVSLPESLTQIKSAAFAGCTNLRKIVIPKNVFSIGSRIINSPNNTVEVHPDNPYYFSYENNIIETNSGTLVSVAFNGIIPENIGIQHLGHSIFFNNDYITSVVVPEGVLTIDGQAFCVCNNLSSVWLPVSLKEIKYSSFSNLNALTDIYYSGTIEQWNSITINHSWSDGSNSFTIHCTDGDITP